MIYVSSSCVKANYIHQSVEKLASSGFTNIELSGGTKNYPDLERDLLKLQDKYGINYLCHNYFPPPETPFVINIASLDDEVHQLSMENLNKAIKLSKKLGADKFGFHAGFLINIPVKEIGKRISKEKLFDRDKAIQRFVSSTRKLQDENPEIKLYLENNVLSGANYTSFEKKNPFFLCSYESYKFFQELMDFNILLDVAHLKVSSRTLGLNFSDELANFIHHCDYIHISDNDSMTDSNKALKDGSELYDELAKYNLKDKTITLEIYDSLEEISGSMELINRMIE